MPETYNIPMGIGVIVALVIFFIVGFAMLVLVRRSGKRFIIAGKQLPFSWWERCYWHKH